jgi:hypothetical protein
MNRLPRSSRIAALPRHQRRHIAGAARLRRAVLFALLLAGGFGSPGISVAQDAFNYEGTAFACRSEFPLADPAALGRDIDSVRAELATATGLEFPAEPILLSLYESRQRYIAEVSQVTDNARRQRGVFIVRDGVTQVYSFQQPELFATLRHESTHALLHSALPYVPLWLDEGLASYFESPHGPDHPHIRKLRFSLRVGWRPNLKSLESRKDSADLDAGDYRHAWAWVNFLLNESDESRALLQRYLHNIAAGEPPQAFSEFVETSMPDARERCVQFLSR